MSKAAPGPNLRTPKTQRWTIEQKSRKSSKDIFEDCCQLKLLELLETLKEPISHKRRYPASWTVTVWGDSHTLVANVGHRCRYKNLQHTNCSLCARLAASRVSSETMFRPAEGKVFVSQDLGDMMFAVELLPHIAAGLMPMAPSARISALCLMLVSDQTRRKHRKHLI